MFHFLQKDGDDERAATHIWTGCGSLKNSQNNKMWESKGHHLRKTKNGRIGGHHEMMKEEKKLRKSKTENNMMDGHDESLTLNIATHATNPLWDLFIFFFFSFCFQCDERMRKETKKMRVCVCDVCKVNVSWTYVVCGGRWGRDAVSPT